METFSFKISEKEDEYLNVLANKWGCNRAEAARKALQLAHDSVHPTINLDQLQEIISGQQRIFDLLSDLAKHNTCFTHLNRLEEYVVQSCFCSGLLAKNAGVYERAKQEYITWKATNRKDTI